MWRFPSTVLPAHLLFLYPTQRFRFVGIGESAQIPCTSAEKIEDGGLSFSWYKRRESRFPVLVKRCNDGETGDRFVCRAKAYSQNSTLEILNVQRSDSGIYFCVTTNYNVSKGLCLLVVGGKQLGLRFTLEPLSGAVKLASVLKIISYVAGKAVVEF